MAAKKSKTFKIELQLTCLSYFSHLGAIFGMPSLTCGFLVGTDVRPIGSPSRIDLSSSGSMSSARLTVFSETES